MLQGILISVGLTLNLAWTLWESWPWWCGSERAGGLTNSATTQAHIKSFGLAHHQYLPNLRTGIHKGTSSEESKLHDLHDLGQQQSV